MKFHLSVFIFLLLIFQSTGLSQSSSIEITKTGLEVENPKFLEIVIEELSKDAEDIGLTIERIKTKSELRLRQSGIEPTDSLPYWLYVNCTVFDNAFNIAVCFRRNTFFNVGNKIYSCYGGITWSKGSTGTFGNDSEYIISSLDEILDSFLNDYLKANPALVKNK